MNQLTGQPIGQSNNKQKLIVMQEIKVAQEGQIDFLRLD